MIKHSIIERAPVFLGFAYNQYLSYKVRVEIVLSLIISSGDSGPPLFGLPPNGLFTFGLSLIGLQGQLDYTQLDYL